MASKRRNMFHKNKTQETTEKEYGVTKQIVKPAMPGGEFSQIIESYRNSGKSATCEHDHKVDELKAEFETQTRWGKSPRADSLYTLEELRKTVESDLAATRKQRSELEEAFLHRVTAPEKIKPVTPIRGDEVIKESMKDTCIVTGSASDKLVEAKDDYPNRISIPEDKRKTTNGLYRVRDCFYDEDGEFLYRVPGMKH
ncbi:hypothetical protein AAG570_001608 [Ranatra chinensis]|uniref:Uncharacterized protein n=1 Tax=Ranatra chinensis TaxID=642074 RepID=A0ABD0YL16_9HEMI